MSFSVFALSSRHKKRCFTLMSFICNLNSAALITSCIPIALTIFKIFGVVHKRPRCSVSTRILGRRRYFCLGCRRCHGRCRSIRRCWRRYCRCRRRYWQNVILRASRLYCYRKLQLRRLLPNLHASGNCRLPCFFTSHGKPCFSIFLYCCNRFLR